MLGEGGGGQKRHKKIMKELMSFILNHAGGERGEIRNLERKVWMIDYLHSSIS